MRYLLILTILFCQVAMADEFGDLLTKYQQTESAEEKAAITEQMQTITKQQAEQLETIRKQREGEQQQKTVAEKSSYKKIKGWIYFKDGRVCKNCTAYQQPNGYTASVKDSSGNEWLTETYQRFSIVKHPYLSRFAQGTAAAASQYSENMQRQQYQQQVINQLNRPRTTTCNHLGYSTYCNSY